MPRNAEPATPVEPDTGTSRTAERIVAATQEIVAAEGAAAVTMRRVASAAGVTTMATYRHFPNRAALLSATADNVSAELGKNWDVGGSSATASFDDVVAELLDKFLDFALGQPHLYSFLVTEPRTSARRFPDDFREHASPAFSPLVETVERGMRDGVLRSDDDAVEVAMTINAAAAGLIQLYQTGRVGCSEEELRALCRRSVGRVIHGIRD